jgi:hypothetical protein
MKNHIKLEIKHQIEFIVSACVEVKLLTNGRQNIYIPSHEEHFL